MKVESHSSLFSYILCCRKTLLFFLCRPVYANRSALFLTSWFTEPFSLLLCLVFWKAVLRIFCGSVLWDLENLIGSNNEECRYIFFADKVEVEDITDKTYFFSLMGPKSNEVCASDPSVLSIGAETCIWRFSYFLQRTDWLTFNL